MDQIGSTWFNLAQTWSNWNKLDQTWSNWIKLDQTWSNWIKLDQIVETWEWGLVPHPYLILCLFIFDYWKTWLKLVMLENLQACFMKISWIGPWVSRIGWCKWHWFGSTYMVVRLSNICSKTGLKCIFCVFRLFLSLCRTASQPYKLRHFNALRINQFY